MRSPTQSPPERVTPFPLRLPGSTAELRKWVERHLSLPPYQLASLLAAIDHAIASSRHQERGCAPHPDELAARVARLEKELSAKNETVRHIAMYFSEVVADLTEKSRRDPKTQLMHFDWFCERLEGFLAVEQRGEWCGVGVVDLTAFKRYNDHYGHAVGDRIIRRVARILARQIRSQDLLAKERRRHQGDLHARFGGDEFCFLITDVPSLEVAYRIADRFKEKVERFDWTTEDARLDANPVKVDVGLACLRLGPVAERREVARALATDLVNRADQLMYAAKAGGASHVYVAGYRLAGGELQPEAPVPSAQK